MKSAEVYPIGIVTSPYRKHGDAPRQGRLDPDVEMEIEIYEEYAAGLGDLAGISHIFVLLWFDRASRTTLTGHPPGATTPKPVFATRSPHRPNPIGLDIAKVLEVDGRIIRVSGLDALDGTPVLDIKPYVPSLDAIPDATEPIRDKPR